MAQYMKDCRQCGETFTCRNAKQAYCSTACKSRWHEARRVRRKPDAREALCAWCAEVFTPYKAQKFCSAACKDSSRNLARVEARREALGLPEWSDCSICGSRFRPWSRGHDVCGSKCRNARTMERRRTSCVGCGAVGDYGQRKNFPDHCRACRPPHRTLLVQAYLDGDSRAVLEILRQRSTETDGGCWVWDGAKTTQGYGCVMVADYIGGKIVNRQAMAHRVALEMASGPLGGLQAHHKCANRSCVNPDHLEPVTSAQNMAEMLARMSYIARIEELEAEVSRLRTELEVCHVAHGGRRVAEPIEGTMRTA